LPSNGCRGLGLEVLDGTAVARGTPANRAITCSGHLNRYSAWRAPPPHHLRNAASADARGPRDRAPSSTTGRSAGQRGGPARRGHRQCLPSAWVSPSIQTGPSRGFGRSRREGSGASGAMFVTAPTPASHQPLPSATSSSPSASSADARMLNERGAQHQLAERDDGVPQSGGETMVEPQAACLPRMIARCHRGSCGSCRCRCRCLGRSHFSWLMAA
jgi:hypothetical protein